MKKNHTLKGLTYRVGGLVLLLGLYGFLARLFVCERDVNYGSYAAKEGIKA